MWVLLSLVSVVSVASAIPDGVEPVPDTYHVTGPSPSPTHPPATSKGAKNVLLIVVDDLRPEVGAYGIGHVKTPNIDKLASTGVLFQRAYIQYSYCSPSRNSFMSGRRPDSTKAWTFEDHFREQGIGDKWSSLPQYFKERGYLTLGAGKIFHPSTPPSFDAPKSWDFFTWPGGCSSQKGKSGWPILEKGVKNVECKPAEAGCPAEAVMEGGHLWCKLDRSKLKVPLWDDLVAQTSIANLRQASKQQHPFFIAVGFHRPHIPFHFPAEFDIYPPASKIAAPAQRLPPKDMPQCAWHDGLCPSSLTSPCSAEQTAELRRAYYSSVSYMDSNVGKVLDTLNELGLANNTVVAFIGDHGFHLGEENLWGKMTNFELGVRIPLIFRVPWAQQAGTKTPALAEAVDLFPTLVEAAGLPMAKEGLEGRSLASVITAPPSKGTGNRQYAFSQFAKDGKNLEGVAQWVHRSGIEAMGYSVRSDNWRLTEWVRWDQHSWKPLWDQQVGLELYDHEGDFGQDFDRASPTRNLAADVQHAGIIRELRQALRDQFAPDLPVIV